jgi:hypothetical protein
MIGKICHQYRDRQASEFGRLERIGRGTIEVDQSLNKRRTPRAGRFRSQFLVKSAGTSHRARSSRSKKPCRSTQGFGVRSSSQISYGIDGSMCHLRQAQICNGRLKNMRKIAQPAEKRLYDGIRYGFTFPIRNCIQIV